MISLTHAAFIAAAFSLCPLAAAAADSGGGGKLPGVDATVGSTVVGVDADTRSAKEPLPQPGAGWVRVGDWDVNISGSVTVDIGTGPQSPNARRNR